MGCFITTLLQIFGRNNFEKQSIFGEVMCFITTLLQIFGRNDFEKQSIFGEDVEKSWGPIFWATIASGLEKAKRKYRH